ncbi:MAG: TolB family protein [Acidobacteriota bacterium]
MATKRKNSSIKTIGLSVTAVLAVMYALVMFASLLIVGVGRTGSWQAALLGIEWSTIAGFEIGLLGIMIAGFAAAAALAPAYNFIRRRVAGRSKTLEPLSQADRPPARSWAFRLLTALLVLLPLTLLILRALASTLSSAGPTGAQVASIQNPGVRTQTVNMGPTINTVFRDTEPTFTADGRTMYFNCYNADICVSYLTGTWEEGQWTPPQRVGAPISTEFEEVEPVINATGDKLYFTSSRPGDPWWRIPILAPFMDVFRVVNTLATGKLGRTFFGGLGLNDIYVSYRIDGAWSEPRNLNDVAGEPPVNSTFHDHCLFLSSDGNEAFWTSTRPGGFGGNDIWTSRRVDGQWTAPENLGPYVNGRDDEHHSSLTPDGRSLFVTSNRAGGYGRDDIYITTRDADGKWGPLVNLGSPINGPGDDRCLTWTPDHRIFLFDSVDPRGFGGRDIWWVYSEDVGLMAASTGATH